MRRSQSSSAYRVGYGLPSVPKQISVCRMRQDSKKNKSLTGKHSMARSCIFCWDTNTTLQAENQLLPLISIKRPAHYSKRRLAWTNQLGRLTNTLAKATASPPVTGDLAQFFSQKPLHVCFAKPRPATSQDSAPPIILICRNICNRSHCKGTIEHTALQPESTDSTLLHTRTLNIFSTTVFATA